MAKTQLHLVARLIAAAAFWSVTAIAQDPPDPTPDTRTVIREGPRFTPPDAAAAHLRVLAPQDPDLEKVIREEGRRPDNAEIQRRLIVLPDGSPKLGPPVPPAEPPK